jgi:hypothetical protein
VTVLVDGRRITSAEAWKGHRRIVIGGPE